MDEEELLGAMEELAPAYARAEHTAVEPLDDVLEHLVQKSADPKGREGLGRIMGVERLASLLPDLSQHSPDLRVSLRDEEGTNASFPRSSSSVEAAPLHPVLLLLRLLRNLCAGVPDNQEQFLICGAQDAVATIADRLILAEVQRQLLEVGAMRGSAESALPQGGAAQQLDSSGKSYQELGSSLPATPPVAKVDKGLPPLSPAESPPNPASSGKALRPSRSILARRSQSSSKLGAGALPPLAVLPQPFPNASAFTSSPSFATSPGSMLSPHPSPIVDLGSAGSHFQLSFPTSVEPPSDVIEVLRAVLQVLCNFAGKGSDTQTAVWERCFPGTLARLAAVKSPLVQGPLCKLIFTCCRTNAKNCELLSTEPEGVSILSALLGAVAPNITAGRVPHAHATAYKPSYFLGLRFGGASSYIIS